jgi:hypothetical protein
MSVAPDAVSLHFDFPIVEKGLVRILERRREAKKRNITERVNLEKHDGQGREQHRHTSITNNTGRVAQ